MQNLNQKKRGRPPKQNQVQNQNPIQPEKLSSKDSSNNEEPETVAEKLDILGQDFLSDKEEKTEKVKKPRGIAAQRIKEEAEQKEKEEMFLGFGSMILSVFIERMKNPKPLTDLERVQVDSTFSRVASKYVSLFGNYQDEVMFGTVLMTLLIPRLGWKNPFGNLFKVSSDAVPADQIKPEEKVN